MNLFKCQTIRLQVKHSSDVGGKLKKTNWGKKGNIDSFNCLLTAPEIFAPGEFIDVFLSSGVKQRGGKVKIVYISYEYQIEGEGDEPQTLNLRRPLASVFFFISVN